MPPHTQRRLALTAASLGFFLVILDSTVVNVALPTLGADLGGAVDGLQWTVDAYLVAFSALLLSAGVLSDRFGARRCFALGLGAFAAASLLCGAAPSLGLLLAARVAQGAAAALLLPASLALVRQAYADPAERTRAIGTFIALGGVAAALGPVLGGLATAALDWRAIFLVNVPACLLALALLGGVPGSARRHVALDLPGQLAAIVAVAALVGAVIEGGRDGFGAPVPVGALGLAAVAAAAFVARARRTPAPLLPLDLLADPRVHSGAFTGLVVNVSMYGLMFVLGLFWQRALGLGPAAAGLAMLPMTGLVAVANLVSGRLTARHGVRGPLLGGHALAACALLPLLLVGTGTPLGLIALLLVPIGVGGAVIIPAMTTAMLDAVPAERAGLAAGLLNASRQFGGALGVAGFGALLHDDLVSGLHAAVTISVALLAASALLAAHATRPHSPRIRSRIAAGWDRNG
ncbi:MAG TPA: MFS transporter [Capillimicrobium sp.]